MNAQAFTVRGKNPKGETYTVITITVIKGYCLPDGVFERTPVGEVGCVRQCSIQGSYVGTSEESVRAWARRTVSGNRQLVSACL